MKHDHQKRSSPSQDVVMASAAEFVDLTKKILCEVPLTDHDMAARSGISLGADAALAWRREAQGKLLKSPIPSALLVLASEVCAPPNVAIHDHGWARDYAFNSLSEKITREEQFKLGIISSVATPDDSEFGVLKSLFSKFPVNTLQLCEGIALNRDNSFDVRERALLFILEADDGRARRIAEQLISVNDNEEVSDLASRLTSSVPAGTPNKYPNTPELPLDILNKAAAVGVAMKDMSLSAQEVSSKIHGLYGDSFVAYVCDLALYRDKSRADYQEPLKKVVTAIPELKFLLSETNSKS